MSRRLRLRSFWRSLHRRSLAPTTQPRFTSVNLLPPEYRPGGVRLERGSGELSVFTGAKARSMTTQATATTAASNSSWLLGDQSGDDFDQTSRVRVSRPIGPGSSGAVMAAPGVSGAPLEPAA